MRGAVSKGRGNALPASGCPPPLTVEDIDAAFVVKDAPGQKLAYAYYEEEPGRRSAHGRGQNKQGTVGAHPAKLLVGDFGSRWENMKGSFGGGE